MPASSGSTSPSTCGAVASSESGSVPASLLVGSAPQALKASARAPRTANLETVFFIALLFRPRVAQRTVAQNSTENSAHAGAGDVSQLRRPRRSGLRMPWSFRKRQRCPQGETRRGKPQADGNRWAMLYEYLALPEGSGWRGGKVLTSMCVASPEFGHRVAFREGAAR